MSEIKKDNETKIEEPVTAVTTKITEPDVIDVNLGFVEKKKFRFNGDFNRMLELNVSDLNVFVRLNDEYPKLEKLFAEAQEKILAIPEDDEVAGLSALADSLSFIDNAMREAIDRIFDAPVSQVCAPSGNMFDPVNSQYRYQWILDVVTGLYANGLNSEFKKMKSKVEKKTSKYAKKGSKYHK